MSFVKLNDSMIIWYSARYEQATRKRVNRNDGTCSFFLRTLFEKDNQSEDNVIGSVRDRSVIRELNLETSRKKFGIEWYLTLLLSITKTFTRSYSNFLFDLVIVHTIELTKI